VESDWSKSTGSEAVCTKYNRAMRARKAARMHHPTGFYDYKPARRGLPVPAGGHSGRRLEAEPEPTGWGWGRRGAASAVAARARARLARWRHSGPTGEGVDGGGSVAVQCGVALPPCHGVRAVPIPRPPAVVSASGARPRAQTGGRAGGRPSGGRCRGRSAARGGAAIGAREKWGRGVIHQWGATAASRP